MPAKYQNSSAYTRSLLLMSAKHRYGLTGLSDWCREPTYLHHKAQVIRLLKEQLSANPADPGDWSFSVILFLLAMEVKQALNPAEYSELLKTLIGP